MDRRGQSTAYPPQRIQRRPKRLALFAAALVVTGLFIFAHISKVDTLYVARGQDAIGKLQKEIHNARPFAHLHNPFRPQAHPPPVQKNSTWGDASWFSDWKWLNPFSSTVTLDEDRALLPPLEIRPPIYTYYDPPNGKSDAILKGAQDRLIEIWRRAWWAQGFRPVVLGPAEAMENPLYQKLQAVKATPVVEGELMRWLAWSHMGDGILANWLALPMAEFYQPTLAHLRTARYTQLTRYLDLQLGLFTGAKRDIDRALNLFLDGERDKHYNSLMDAINEIDDEKDLFRLEAKSKGVAFYSEAYISEAFTEVAKLLDTDRVKGLVALGDLITAHLHATFLSKYPDGIAVVLPYIEDATLLSHRAVTFASILNTCPKDPLSADQKQPLASCPPNRQNCKACQSVGLSFPSAAANATTIFTVGTVPHAFVLSRLMAPHDADFNFTVPYVRRTTKRDPFVEAVTAETATKGSSSYFRIMDFKEGVAQSGKGAMRSIWRTAEADWDWDALEWRLGFELTKPAQIDVSDAKGNPIAQTKIGPAQVAADKVPDSLAIVLHSMLQKPSSTDLIYQDRVFKESVDLLAKKKWQGVKPFDKDIDMRKVSESWHLADSEAWRFVRAMQAREELERKKWMDEESMFRR